MSIPAVGSTQSPVQWVAGVKRPGYEADHSSPSDAEVNNEWSRTCAGLIMLTENENDPTEIIYSL